MNLNAHDPADEEDLDVPEEFDDEHEAAAWEQFYPEEFSDDDGS